MQFTFTINATLQSLHFWGGIAFCSLIVAASLGAKWEERINRETPVFVLRGGGGEAQAATARAAVRPSTSQKIREINGVITADYTFSNFNSDPLAVAFSIAATELAAYRQEYGYTTTEREAIDLWQKAASKEAYQNAVKNRQSQEQLNRAVEKISAEYRTRLAHFFKTRCFALIEGNLLIVDMPAIVRKNIKRTRAIALSLNSSGEKLGYDSDSIIAAALSFVQTAIKFADVPMEINGRHAGGLHPPLETLSVGKGDCDTKTALLASILLNWNRVKVVGVALPGHYLMGVLRNPAKGDVFVEYQGGRYVLLEPAGPGWLPPGNVDRKTMAFINAGDNVRIESFNPN